MSAAVRIGLVGLGKIARDQHLPAIASTDGAELFAVASRNAGTADLPCFPDLTTMLRDGPAIDAVSLCQPPQARYDAAREALLAGKHVFMEKPPGVTVSEVQALTTLATERGVTLFASWHSRYAAGVAAARAWLAERALQRISISWKEDVRHWHPGQTWIWQPGGFGVFDPGINALSILTEIVAEPLRAIAATLETPSNCQAPSAARLTMATASGKPVEAEFDFLQTGPQTWDIVVETDRGSLTLGHGGNNLIIDGVERPNGAEEEYPAMYRHFVRLIAERRSDVDLAPLQLVADAFLCGRNLAVAEFHE
ncbi:MAG: Gfo/Idh/MocA family oxidoreductase [Novosphingobium sp.]